MKKLKINKKFSFEIQDQLFLEEKSYYEQDSLTLDEFIKSLDSEEPKPEHINYSNKSVKKAGRSLRKRTGNLKNALTIIRLFRAAHQEPLDSIANILNNMCEDLEIDFIFPKRLKRVETIVDKLRRFSLDGNNINSMCITNMNDIGGCRIICKNIVDLNIVENKILAILEKTKNIKLLQTYLH